MTVISNSVTIQCPAEEAFDYLSDHRNELDWNPKCQIMEKITEGPVGLGTKFRAKWTLSPVVEVEIVEYDRPHSWTAHNGGALEVTLRGRLETVPEGVRLHADFHAQPHGLMRLMFPFMLRKLRAEEAANMGLLRDALERRCSPTV